MGNEILSAIGFVTCITGIIVLASTIINYGSSIKNLESRCRRIDEESASLWLKVTAHIKDHELTKKAHK